MVIVMLELVLKLKLLVIITMIIVKDNNNLKFIASYIKNRLSFHYYHDNSEMQGLSFVLMNIITMILTNGL